MGSLHHFCWFILSLAQVNGLRLLLHGQVELLHEGSIPLDINVGSGLRVIYLQVEIAVR